MKESTQQILIAVLSAGAAAATAVLVTHYLTKKATIENVASGKEPLPAGATPTTKPPEPAALPPAPATPPTTNTDFLSQMAAAFAKSVPPSNQCPPGYTYTPPVDPEGSGLCTPPIQCPPGYHFVASDIVPPGMCLQDK